MRIHFEFEQNNYQRRFHVTKQVVLGALVGEKSLEDVMKSLKKKDQMKAKSKKMTKTFSFTNKY
jgi:hypothetical protein